MKLKYVGKLVAGIAAAMLLCIPSVKAQAAGENTTKIHFISLDSTTDAILLESNGHFGMVDSGEDWDYPDGENYVLRDGVTQGIGYEQQVIHYLEQLGVEKLDFYIATHAHSDHIGTGDEILNHFPTERLYIQHYDDSYSRDAHGSDPLDPYYYQDAMENRLWDNQYVYDHIMSAAKQNGTEIITDLEREENAEYRTFSLGDMSIEIMNFERDRDENGMVIPVVGENSNSLVIRVSAYGKTAVLTGDMDPVDGDSIKLVNQLAEQMGTSEGNADIQVIEEYEVADYEAESNVDLELSKERTDQIRQAIDETKPNTEFTLDIDLLKMSHHSVDGNNTTYFLTSMNPENVVITGYKSWYNAREKSCMPEAKVYATATDSAAVVASFDDAGMEMNYVKVDSGWDQIDGKWYYFDENGRTYTDSSCHEIAGETFCFNQMGGIEESSRWAKTEKGWMYWNAEGAQGYVTMEDWMQLDGKNYYFDSEGIMAIGWKKITDDWHYFNQDGSMVTDTWIGGYYVNPEGIWKEDSTAARWCQSGTGWWYQYADGTYPAAEWKKIDGKMYYFDAAGWMKTGWCQIGADWYYLDSNGARLTDAWIGDYYVDKNGVWDTSVKRAKWISSGGWWWYQYADGTYPISEWQEIDGKWYYFDEAGWMVTGWREIDKDWYYLNSDGSMAAKTWVGNYYVDEYGIWNQDKKKSEWIQSGGWWWYRHWDGSYTASGWEEIDGKKYYFDQDGWMVTGWQKLKDKWYYLDPSGAMVSSAWVGDYYLKADGTMAVSEWVQNGWYYVGEDGRIFY